MLGRERAVAHLVEHYNNEHVELSMQKRFCILQTRPQGYKTFFMLNSTEHLIFHAHKLLAF